MLGIQLWILELAGMIGRLNLIRGFHLKWNDYQFLIIGKRYGWSVPDSNTRALFAVL